MFRLLPWGSGGIGGDKAADGMKVLGVRAHNVPRLDPAKTSKNKRKRSDSESLGPTFNPASPTRKCAEEREHLGRYPQVVVPHTHQSPENDLSSVQKDKAAEPSESPPFVTIQSKQRQWGRSQATYPSPTTSDNGQVSQMARSEKDRKALQQIISQELNMAILMKHNELRLIDQEIAKAQIALEQLRRCREIPYPTNTPSLEVSRGTGPSVRPPGRKRLPPSPAPWGVTDGPYARHYAKWLLPDSSFDGGDTPSSGVAAASASKMPTKGRSTRGSFTDVPAADGKSRSHRGGASSLQALSSGYPQPKGSSGPMIQRRKSDGQMVKLVCLDCRRSDFSSAQGFINHCRIAHNRSFASHDAAADACGEPVETDESGAVIGSDMPSASTASLIHPLIRSAHLLKNQKAPITNLHNADSSKEEEPPPTAPSTIPAKRKRGRKPKNAASEALSAFIPSPATPHLSSLLNARGSDINLQDAVSDAQTPVKFDESSEDESETESAATPPANVHGGLTLRGGLGTSLGPSHGHVGRLPRSTMSPAPLDRPNSRKGLDKPPARGRKPNSLIPPVLSTPLPPAPPSYTGSNHQDEETIPDASTVEPSPTNDSNQAPSLISDSDTNDDYEAASVSESSISASGGDSAVDDDLDVDVEVEDYENESAGPSRQVATAAHDEHEGRLKQQRQPVRRASAFRRRSVGGSGHTGGEEKHVSFVGVSPQPRTKKGSRGGRRAKAS